LLLAAAGAAWVCCSAAAEEMTQRINQNDNTVSVVRGGGKVFEYRYTDVPFKPCLQELFTPGGVQVLRDSPHDHKHHHALMFAVAVDGVDFWGEVQPCGWQVSRGIEGVRSSVHDGESQAAFTQQLEWLGPDDAPRLTERRSIALYGGKDISATLLTWRSRLAAPAGKESVKLGGHHYYGLGIRFVESMDQAGRFFNSEAMEGELVRGSERLTPARWCAYTSAADGKPVTVAIFDHPRNPRRSARFFTMRPPFAYLGATINLWKEPFDLSAGASLDLRYGVALWDGEIEPAQVEKVYQQWTKLEP
jgi:hypothetical protein